MSERDIAVERLGADYFQDPYSVHARLRAQRPVTPVIMPGGAAVWLITGYAEARAALADPRMSKRMPGWHPEPGSVIATMDLHMLNTDTPDHGRLPDGPAASPAGLRPGDGRVLRPGEPGRAAVVAQGRPG